MRLFIPALLLIMGSCVAACNNDKILAGRRALGTDPAEAIAILSKAEQEQAPCFECGMYLGLAYEKTGRGAEAAAAYERILALEGADRRPEPVKGRLLAVYKGLFAEAGEPGERLSAARKAAVLEAELQVASPWANEFLFSKYDNDLDTNATTGQHGSVRESAKAIQGLYLPVEKKKAAARKATDLMRTGFIQQSKTAFLAKLAPGFSQKGLYDKARGEIVLKNRFVIPSVREDPSLDPKVDGFLTRVRGLSCLPLRERLEEAVTPLAEAVGFRKPAASDLDRLFHKLFTYAKAGFETYGAEKKDPTGQVFLCMIQSPLDAFLGEMFRFSE